MSPGGLSFESRTAIAVAGLVVAALVAWFGRRQNARRGLGGAISGPKQAWLAYTIFVWFFVCPIVALDRGVHPALRLLLAAFAALMWARGVAELLMLYRWRNWRPPYGIGHDALCLVVLLAGGASAAAAIGPHPGALDQRVLALCALVAASLVVEIVYAALFFHAVAGATTGEAGVWFAAEDEPRFLRINRLTTMFNLALYAGLAGFLWSTWR